MVATWERLGQDLRAAGLDVTDIWQVVRMRDPYPDAVPVLIRWTKELPQSEPPSAERDRLLEGVVRALSIPEAGPAAAGTLLDLFPETSGPLQWIVGNAIAATASPDHADRILDLIADARFGWSRQMLVLAAGRVAGRNPRTLAVIRACVDDDAVAAHAMTVLANLDPYAAVEIAARKQGHYDPATVAAARRAYQSALRRIELVTTRLRLEPVGPANAGDLWRVHADEEVWRWYHSEKPARDQAEEWAGRMGESWRLHGVHKWIAYERESGEVVGRGGLSRTPVDDDWGQIYAFLPAEPWVRAAHDARRPFVAHANWLELGWALRSEFRGHGYASEIGRAGLAFAFDVLGVQAVVSCTVRHNTRSRKVMDRLGMRYAGEIRSRGKVDGLDGEREDAPYAVSIMLRTEWEAAAESPLPDPGAHPQGRFPLP